MANYWGYNSIGFFAPHAAYSSSGSRGQQVTEFKQMVKNFHRAGIEVILDVVYNHTAEGGTDGPTYSFRGLDDLGFYKRSGTGHDSYWDVTGCGNTVDTTNRGALRMILDSLRYWATEMHVDGFRFDLTSALARTGHDIDMRGAFMTAIQHDPVLRYVKLIAEPWDASMDGYRVGSFPPPWVEWNDRYRDTVRDFWREGDGRHPRDLVPAGRLVGPVRRRRALAVLLGQLRDRPRRVHAARPGVLRPEAQRGQRRAQPRRQRQQPVLELRGRGRDRRRGDHRAAAPAGGEPDGHALPVQRRPDADRGRRARPHPAAATTTPTCRTTRSPGSTGGPTTRGSTSTRSPRPRSGCAASTRRCGSATTSTAPRPSRAVPRTWPGCTRSGREMTTQGLGRRRPARRRHVRVRRPAALPRPARRAAARRVVHDLAATARTRPSTSPCPRTSGCAPARWCSPPTPT